MQINWPDGIDTDVFLKEYWQQKPLLIKQAFPGFESPIDENELAGLTLDPDANSRYMECVNGHEWRMTHGPFADDFYDGVSGNQWSILVSDVEKLLPEFRQYIEPFRFIPDWRIDDLMISYAPVGGSVGAHVDQYDVFLLQASGQREWQIETSARPPNTSSSSAAISLLADFNADKTMQLDAGDMLYLPPQNAHHGIAVADPCMTWSIGFRAPSVDEMLPSVIGYLLEDIPNPERYTDPARARTNKPGQIDNGDLQRLRDMITASLNAPDLQLDKAIGRFLTESLNSEATESRQAEWSDLPDTLHCNSAFAFAWKNTDDQTILFADGEAYALSAATAATLCEHRSITVSNTNAQERDTILLLYNRHALLSDDE